MILKMKTHKRIKSGFHREPFYLIRLPHPPINIMRQHQILKRNQEMSHPIYLPRMQITPPTKTPPTPTLYHLHHLTNQSLFMGGKQKKAREFQTKRGITNPILPKTR
jgi:hypothetical protein